jgi:hypothetical protein
MCDCSDYDTTVVGFHETWRRAYKVHHCCECRGAIQKGDRYQYVSGIWDGTPCSMKTCARCAILRDAHVLAEEDLQRIDGVFPSCAPEYGRIAKTIGECIREDRRYIEAFRRWRRELSISNMT